MGQPEDLLYPLHMTDKPTGNVSYLVTSQYNQTLGDLKEKMVADAQKSGAKLEFLRDKVKSMGIQRMDKGFIVSTTKFSERHTTLQVIIASGAGPNQTLGAMKIPVQNEQRLSEKGGRTYPEIISSEEYVKWHPNKEGLRILVYGGEPSSAWAAAHAMYSRPSLMMWMARSGFTGANPAGRNSAIVLHASESDSMFIGTVSGIKVLDVASGPRLSIAMTPSTSKINPTIPLRTEGDSPFEVDGRIGVLQEEVSLVFDQFVYATGADPTGVLGSADILHPTLRSELVPYYDKNGRFRSDTALVAFTTTKEDLWVVGASVFRALRGIKDFTVEKLKGQYQAIPEMFCDAGTPPEGLAVVKALLKSVTGYNEPGGSRFNWNTADMVELVGYLQSRYQNQLTPGDRQFIANKVIQRRSGKDVGRDKNLPAQPSHYPAFGLTEAEFNKCVQEAAKERGKQISSAWQQVQVPKPVKLTV